MKKVTLLTILLVVAASAAITIEFPDDPPDKVGDSVKVTITASVVVDLAVDSNGTKKPWVSPQTLSPGTNYVQITHPGSGLMLYASKLGDEDYSDPFNVVIGDAERWQIIGPGQTPDPGNAGNPSGKTPNTAAVTAGDVETYPVNLCDKWYNVVNPSPTGYTITTNDPFGRVNGDQVELRTAGTWNVIVSGSDYTPDTSKVKVNVGEATQLLLLCPGEDALPGDNATSGSPGKYGDLEDATLGSKYLVEIRAVDDCWNQVTSYNDPDVNVFAGTENLTAAQQYGIDNGTTGKIVDVVFKEVNRQGEWIDAIGSLGLRTDYSTPVKVQPGIDRLEAEFKPSTVPVGVHADLEARAWVADVPLLFGWADVELIEGSATHFHLDTTSIKIEDGVGSVDAWADTVGTYTVKVTAGDQADTVVLTVEERPGVTVIPNPFKYGAEGHDKIKFSYKVEETGAAEVLLLIADLYGNIVYKATYTSGEVVSPGTQEISWDGTNSKGKRIASGMYQAVVKITLTNLSTEVSKKNFMVIW